ncbi:AP2 domain-containing protein, partial [Cephalotus follicularis]
RRRQNGCESVEDTLAKWKKHNIHKVEYAKDGEERIWKVPSKGSKKGCMQGKRGPENSVCKYRGVRQRVWRKWVAEIPEPIDRSNAPSKGSRLWLGTYSSVMEAALAYGVVARTMYGPHAILNSPEAYSNSVPQQL